MVELPQENIPASQAVEITEVPPVEIADFPAIELAGEVQTATLPAVGLKRLYGPAQPGAAGSPSAGEVIYAVPSPAVKVVLKNVVLCNTTGAAAWLQLGINGAAPENCLINEAEVAPHETLTFNLEIPLEPGETINAFQQTAGAITVTMIGTETPL